MRWILVAIILLLVLGYAAAKDCGKGAKPDGTPYEPCNCGDRLMTNYALPSDLNDGSQNICSGNALAVGAENITIDCAGHTIAGNGYVFGGVVNVGINAGTDGGKNLLVKNCKITGFAAGIDGRGYYSVEDSEFFGNSMGLRTIWYVDGTPCKLLRNNFHDNTWPMVMDETANAEVGFNHFHNNKNGLQAVGIACWTTDLSALCMDNLYVHDNIVENNETYGLRFSASYSRLENNIVRYNATGLEYEISQTIYRIWVTLPNGTVTVKNIEGEGKKRTNHNIIKNNEFYSNETADFKIVWNTNSFADFVNTIENNTVNGKPVYFFFQANGQSFSGLDASSFYCASCKNINISDSKIQDLYLFDTNDSDFTNLTMQGGEYGIYLYNSHRNNFNGYTISAKHPIYKFNSEDNNFNGTSCDDSDGDGICAQFDNCPGIANPTQADTDKDGVGDACTEKQIGCIADLDKNGKLSTYDLLILRNNLYRTNCSLATNWCNLADLDRNGSVGLDDNSIFYDSYNNPKVYLGCDCSKTQELCDGLDNDCDSAIDEGCECINQTARDCEGGNDCKFYLEKCVNGAWDKNCAGTGENKANGTACSNPKLLGESKSLESANQLFGGKNSSGLVILVKEDIGFNKLFPSAALAIALLLCFLIAGTFLLEKKQGSQAALEYLITYGWALVLIVTVATILFFVFSPSTTGILFSSSQPTKFLLRGGAINDTTLQISLQNATGGNASITSATLPESYPANACTFNTIPITSGTEISQGINIQGGGQLSIKCSGIENPSGTISIEYNDFAAMPRTVDIAISSAGAKKSGVCCNGTCMSKGTIC